MILPRAHEVQVPEAKVSGYLLSTTHPMGQSKAAFFLRFGFKVEKWRELASALMRHAMENPVTALETTPFGTRYLIDGPLRAPNGAALNVRSVWFISRGIEIPRFVTAHPLKRISK